MFGYLIILFTVVPALELAVLIQVGSVIGVGKTLFVIVLTGVIGAYLARYQGFAVLINIQKQLNQGIMPTEDMLDGLMILVGGIVLLTPGFITDTLGFLLLIPLTRRFLKHLARKRIQSMVHQGQIHVHEKGPERKGFGDYEDADFH